MKLIVNCIMGRKDYITYRNHTSIHRQFKTGVLSPTLFNICPSDLLPPRAPVQVKAYADNITITSTHTRTSTTNKYIQPYIYAYTFSHNNLTLDPGKTTYNLFTPDSAEYKSHLEIKKNTAIPMATNPKVLGLTLDQKSHILSTHSQHLTTRTQSSTNIKALTATGWGTQKETLMTIYKAVVRLALEYASSIRSPLASLTSINNL